MMKEPDSATRVVVGFPRSGRSGSVGQQCGCLVLMPWPAGELDDHAAVDEVRGRDKPGATWRVRRRLLGMLCR